ncbi:MAG TPA: cytochrome c [Terriglobales bacterium]|nr:cytochrome c [Terriglobales bacterium]
MLKHLLVVLSLFLLVGFVFSQEKQTPPSGGSAAPYTIPDEAVHQANPVPSTPEALAEGKKWYGLDCAMCHGATGDGKGGVAADMKTKVSDFTDPATLKPRTDGELFYIIKNGKGEMPGEGTRLKSTELWSLVDYIRSFSKKSSTGEKAAPEQKTETNKTPQ